MTVKPTKVRIRSGYSYLYLESRGFESVASVNKQFIGYFHWPWDFIKHNSIFISKPSWQPTVT